MIGALVLGLLVAQVVTVPPQQAPLTQNRAPVPVVAPPGAPGAPSARVDRQFALASMESSYAEVTMAQLALMRGRADEIKQYARQMIAEHAGIMRAFAPEIKRVLKGVASPQRLSPSDALTLYRLQHVSDVAFDQTYVLAEVGGHIATYGAFGTEIEDGADARLKMLAKQWAPTIQAHLQLAVGLTEHIGGDSPLKTGAQ